MPITDFLERNAKIYPNDVALVEINPEKQPAKNTTWREYNLIETAAESDKYRREITWKEFDVRANRFANLLFTRGIKRGDKVAILMMNCLEWLPIYFGILKTGALVVPMNYRYSSDEIKYCLDLADVRMLVFGPEFIERINAIKDDMGAVDNLFFVGERAATPEYADNYAEMTYYCSSMVPPVEIKDSDDGAIYSARHCYNNTLTCYSVHSSVDSPESNPNACIYVHSSISSFSRSSVFICFSLITFFMIFVSNPSFFA